MLLASWNDYRTHRVPNWLNALLASGGLAAQTATFGWQGLGMGLAGMLTGFGLLIVLWLMRGMGAGDVKFMAAIGAWLGPQLTLYAVAAGGLAGGVIGILFIIRQKSWRQTSANFGVLISKMGSIKSALSEFGSAAELSRSTAVLPYAIPLTVGTMFVVVCDYIGWWEVL